MNTVIALSLWFMCCASCFLIFCPSYDDGFFGRIALSALAVASGVGLVQFLAGDITFNPVSQTILLAVTLWQVRRVWSLLKIESISYEEENERGRAQSAKRA